MTYSRQLTLARREAYWRALDRAYPAVNASDERRLALQMVRRVPCAPDAYQYWNVPKAPIDGLAVVAGLCWCGACGAAGFVCGQIVAWWF